MISTNKAEPRQKNAMIEAQIVIASPKGEAINECAQGWMPNYLIVLICVWVFICLWITQVDVPSTY